MSKLTLLLFVNSRPFFNISEDKIDHLNNITFAAEICRRLYLRKEDALRRDKWRDGVQEIAEGMG